MKAYALNPSLARLRGHARARWIALFAALCLVLGLSGAVAGSAGAVALTGYPDASTTGWRHTGVTLVHSGGITVTVAGTVIDSKDVAGLIAVKANNVTIKRSRVTAGGYYPIRLYGGFSGLSVVDVEVVGVNTGSAGCDVGINGGTLIQRVDVSNCQDGLHPSANSSVLDSYVHAMYRNSTSHNDGIQIMAGSNYVIRHNTILIGHAQNSAVFVKADFGSINNVVIDNNRLDGGVYTVFGGDVAPRKVTNVKVTNNVFTPFVKGGQTGAIYGNIFTSRMTGPVTNTGNVDTNGAPVH